MDQQPAFNWSAFFTARFPAISLGLGLAGLITFCYPPFQLFLGGFAVLLAIVSRQGRSFRGTALAGLIFGIISVVCSILMFAMYMMSIQIINDPANAELVAQIMRQYQDVFSQLQTPQ